MNSIPFLTKYCQLTLFRTGNFLSSHMQSIFFKCHLAPWFPCSHKKSKMVNNSFQHSNLAEKLLMIQPYRCKVKEFQRVKWEPWIYQVYGFLQSLQNHLAFFGKNSQLTPKRLWAAKRWGRPTMRRAGAAGPGFIWPVPHLLPAPRPSPAPRRHPLGGRRPLAREHSLMFSVPAAGSPLSPPPPHPQPGNNS